MTKFINGIGWDGSAENLSLAMQLNADAVRVDISWKEVEPILIPEGYDYTWRWASVDRKILPYFENGFHVFARIGVGFTDHLPMMDDTNPLPVDSDYRYYLIRHIKAVVDRYAGKVFCWILEGELNEAQLATLFKWRHGALWNNDDFKTDLIREMSSAIKAKDPASQVMICLHTDIHANIHHHPIGRILTGNKDWTEYLGEWKDMADAIGLDAYPNYYGADPNYGDELGNRIAAAKAISSKPIYLMETSYPRPASGQDLPYPMNFTEQKQYDYVRSAYESVKSKGAAGFFYFTLRCHGVIDRYKAKDLTALQILGRAFHEGDVDSLLTYAMKNLSYLQNEFPAVLQYVESGLGILGKNDEVTPAYSYLYTQYSPLIPGEQRIRLATGWNLFSLSVIPSEADVEKVLTPIAGKYTSIWTMVNGKWQWYLPASPSSSNLKTIGASLGYWILMTESCILAIKGDTSIPSIDLAEGWNLISGLIQEPCDVRSYFASIAGLYRSVWDFDQESGWRWYIPGSPMGSNLSIIRPGRGYWVDVIQECRLIVEK